jgi:hypothetical protein
VHPAPPSKSIKAPAYLNISTTSAITITAPPMPAATVAVAPSITQAVSAFAVFETSCSIKVRQISGRAVIYSITADATTEGDLRRLTAMARSQSLIKEMAIKFSQEAKPSGNKNGIYRHYSIDKSYPMQISSINIEINLPASLSNPSVLLQNGTSATMRLIARDAYSALYQFALPSLEPFSVETHE